jgi:outer membrane protein assembly factor BamB
MAPACPGKVQNMTTPLSIRIPRGIVDTRAEVAYVAGRDGRIVCLSLETGDVLASTDRASLPLAVDKGMLIGWSYGSHRPNVIHLFSAARQGRVIPVQWEQTLELPEWVDPRSPEPESFMLAADIREDRVIITWEAHARYRGGAAPPVEVEKAALYDERQIIELDGKDGTYVGKPRVEPLPPTEPATPPPKPGTTVVSYRSGTTWETQRWRAGAVDACLIAKPSEPGIVLLIEAGLGAEAQIRLTGNPNAVAAVTLDGSLIFIHDPDQTERVWQVFSAETGARIPSLGFDPGSEGVSVVNDSIFYVVREVVKGKRRRTLRCRNVPTGKPVWSFLLDEEAVKPAPPPPR